MKKLFVAALVLVLTAGAVNAQNTFRGIVKFQLTSTGKVDVPIPADQATVEIKVFDNKILAGQTLQDGLKMVQAADISQAIAYLNYNDITLDSYEGDGKILIRDEASKAQLDSSYLEDKEAGHYYYEFGNGTREILGYQAKELIMHHFDENGTDSPTTCWYTTEIGPEYCLVIGAIKGFPLIYTMDAGEGRCITYTATEIVKGKVKASEMLLPDGYKDLSKEAFEALQQELQDAFELLQD